MAGRLKSSIARAALAYLCGMTALSALGLHFHHQDEVRTPAGVRCTACEKICHETCPSETPIEHVFELLANAARFKSSAPASIEANWHFTCALEPANPALLKADRNSRFACEHDDSRPSPAARRAPAHPRAPPLFA
jgi:hypothetical protein